MSDVVAPRILKINILRFDPHDKNDFPHIDTFEVEEAEG